VPIFPLLHICRKTIRQSLCWGSANSTQSLLQTTVSPPPSSVGRKVVLNNSLHTPTHSYYANPFISSTVFVLPCSLFCRFTEHVLASFYFFSLLSSSLFGRFMYACSPCRSSLSFRLMSPVVYSCRLTLCCRPSLFFLPSYGFSCCLIASLFLSFYPSLLSYAVFLSSSTISCHLIASLSCRFILFVVQLLFFLLS
jgi:hypothetical protein